MKVVGCSDTLSIRPDETVWFMVGCDLFAIIHYFHRSLNEVKIVFKNKLNIIFRNQDMQTMSCRLTTKIPQKGKIFGIGRLSKYVACLIKETLDAIKVSSYPFAYTGPIFRDTIVPSSTRLEMPAKSDKNSLTIALCDIVIIS